MRKHIGEKECWCTESLPPANGIAATRSSRRDFGRSRLQRQLAQTYSLCL